MLIAACPSAEVPPRTTIVWPEVVSKLCRKNVHAVAYDSGIAARCVHAIDDAVGIPGAITRLPVTPQRLRAILERAGR